MEKTFQTLNELETAGLVTRYAIGGAFALSFYTEPITTEAAPGARASARFTVRQPDAPHPSSRLTSVGALKRRERRAPTLPALRLGLRPQPSSVPISGNSKPIEFDGFGNCGEFAIIKNPPDEPTPFLTPSNSMGLRIGRKRATVLIPSNSTGLENNPSAQFGLAQGERLKRLNQIAIRQMRVLTSSNLKALPGVKEK